MRGPEDSRRRLPVVVFAAALAVYWFTVSPVVHWGDSAELSRRALSLELSPIARGYPLHRLICWAAGGLVGDAAVGSNLVSAVFGATTVALLHETGRRVGGSAWAGAAAACATGLAHTFWTYCGVAEVYTLHTALLAAALLTVVAYDGLSVRSRVALGAVLGFSFLHHRMMVFAVPGLALWAWLRTPAGSRLRAAGHAAAGFAAGLAPFVVLCVAASPHRAAPSPEPLRDWFEDVFLGGESNVSLLLVEHHKTLAESAAYLARWLALNLAGPALVLVPVGLAALRRRAGRGALAGVAALIVAHLWFPLRYDWTGDQYSFLVPLYPVLSVAVAAGVGLLGDRWGARAAAAAAIAVACAPVLTYAALGSTALGERAFPGLQPEYARRVCWPPRHGDRRPLEECVRRLGSVPEGALLHCDWGDGQVYLFLQDATGLRRDVEVRIWHRRIRLVGDPAREEWLSALPFTRETPRAVRGVEDRLEPRGGGLFRVRAP